MAPALPRLLALLAVLVVSCHGECVFNGKVCSGRGECTADNVCKCEDRAFELDGVPSVKSAQPQCAQTVFEVYPRTYMGLNILHIVINVALLMATVYVIRENLQVLRAKYASSYCGLWLQGLLFLSLGILSELITRVWIITDNDQPWGLTLNPVKHAVYSAQVGFNAISIELFQLVTVLWIRWVAFDAATSESKSPRWHYIIMGSALAFNVLCIIASVITGNYAIVAAGSIGLDFIINPWAAYTAYKIYKLIPSLPYLRFGFHLLVISTICCQLTILFALGMQPRTQPAWTWMMCLNGWPFFGSMCRVVTLVVFSPTFRGREQRLRKSSATGTSATSELGKVTKITVASTTASEPA